MKHRAYSTFSHHRFLDRRDLNAEESEWFAIAIAEAVVSDDIISEGQLAWIQQAVHFLEHEDRQKYLASIKNRRLPRLKPLHLVDREKAARMFLDLVLIILENFEIDEREVEFLIEVGTNIGIKPQRSQDVINWGNQLLAHFREKDRFIDRIKRDEPDYP